MTDLVLGLIVGALGALSIAGVGSWFAFRRLGLRHQLQLSAIDTMLLELRQESAEDKETNRRLRHELAVKTPGHLLETATSAEMERDSAVSERDQAMEQLELVHRDLAGAKTRLADQEARLRQYREALQEIRLSLEAQGRGRSDLDHASSMLDAGALAGPDPAGIAVAEPTDIRSHDRAAVVGGPEPGESSPEPADLGAGD